MVKQPREGCLPVFRVESLSQTANPGEQRGEEVLGGEDLKIVVILVRANTVRSLQLSCLSPSAVEAKPSWDIVLTLVEGAHPGDSLSARCDVASTLHSDGDNNLPGRLADRLTHAGRAAKV